MENRAKIEEIRHRYLKGLITLDEAKGLVQPILDDINTKGRRISKEHGFKFKPLTFAYIFR